MTAASVRHFLPSRAASTPTPWPNTRWPPNHPVTPISAAPATSQREHAGPHRGGSRAAQRKRDPEQAQHAERQRRVNDRRLRGGLLRLRDLHEVGEPRHDRKPAADEAGELAQVRRARGVGQDAQPRQQVEHRRQRQQRDRKRDQDWMDGMAEKPHRLVARARLFTTRGTGPAEERRRSPPPARGRPPATSATRPCADGGRTARTRPAPPR